MEPDCLVRENIPWVVDGARLPGEGNKLMG